MTIPSAPIRLLIIDESIAFGGVERVLMGLVPELTQLVEAVVWLLPEHRIKNYQAVLSLSRLHYESFQWPTRSLGKLHSALLRRIASRLPSVIPALEKRLERSIEEARIQSIIRRYGITHLLYPALFTQRFPSTSLPVWGVVQDVNYHADWKEDCIDNLAIWGRRAKGLIAGSKYTAREIGKLYPNLSEHTYPIPHAADWNERRTSLALSHSAPTNTLRLYYPATLGPHKQHLLLLRALRILHNSSVDFHLTLTGGGTDLLASNSILDNAELSQAQRLFLDAPTEFQAKISCLGRVEATQVDEYFAAADLVVLPSAYEGFGLPLSEAVARRTSVLCSDIPAFREQVDLYGFTEAVRFVETNTPEAWAVAILAARNAGSSFPYPAAQLGPLFKRWTWTEVAKTYVAILLS